MKGIKFLINALNILSFCYFSASAYAACEPELLFSESAVKLTNCIADAVKKEPRGSITSSDYAKKIVEDLCRTEADAHAEFTVQQSLCTGNKMDKAAAMKALIFMVEVGIAE